MNHCTPETLSESNKSIKPWQVYQTLATKRGSVSYTRIKSCRDHCQQTKEGETKRQNAYNQQRMGAKNNPRNQNQSNRYNHGCTTNGEWGNSTGHGATTKSIGHLFSILVPRWVLSTHQKAQGLKVDHHFRNKLAINVVGRSSNLQAAASPSSGFNAVSTMNHLRGPTLDWSPWHLDHTSWG